MYWYYFQWQAGYMGADRKPAVEYVFFAALSGVKQWQC